MCVKTQAYTTISGGVNLAFHLDHGSSSSRISTSYNLTKHRAYHSWQLVFRNRFHPWNPADFTWNLPDFTPWNPLDFTWNPPDFMNMSFWVMIKYRSFFRRTQKSRNIVIWQLLEMYILFQNYTPHSCKNCGDNITILWYSVSDFNWLHPWVLKPGWMHIMDPQSILARSRPEPWTSCMCSGRAIHSATLA